MEPALTILDVITLGREMLFTALFIALPMLGIGLLVGVMVSIFQAATQIHEQTLTIVPKLVAVALALLFSLPLLIRVLLDFTVRLFESLPGLIQ